MPRSRLDPHKRKMAQALNHLAGAVIDINDVYQAFDESISRMVEADVENGVANNAEAIERYRAYKETLRQTMMYTVIPREQIVKFIMEAWGLDEESIKVYLG